jgi:magnesium-transporting ATPase (P-type)
MRNNKKFLFGSIPLVLFICWALISSIGNSYFFVIVGLSTVLAVSVWKISKTESENNLNESEENIRIKEAKTSFALTIGALFSQAFLWFFQFIASASMFGGNAGGLNEGLFYKIFIFANYLWPLTVIGLLFLSILYKISGNRKGIIGLKETISIHLWGVALLPLVFISIGFIIGKFF